MKKLIILALFAVSMVSLFSCDNWTSRKWGGSMTIVLPKGEKLVDVTWRGNNLWYLTEPMDADYEPKTKIFREDSNLGILEGTVTFVESRKAEVK